MIRRRHYLLLTWTSLLIFFELEDNVVGEEGSSASRISQLHSKLIPGRLHSLHEIVTGQSYFGNSALNDVHQPALEDYKPLRIQPFFHLSKLLLENESKALKIVMKRALTRISKILSGLFDKLNAKKTKTKKQCNLNVVSK